MRFATTQPARLVRRARLDLARLAGVVGVVLASGCGDDSVAPLPSAYFRFSVDGVSYSTQGLDFSSAVGLIDAEGTHLFVVGLWRPNVNAPSSTVSTVRVTANIPQFHGVGSYSIGLLPGDQGEADLTVVSINAIEKISRFLTNKEGAGVLDITSYDATRRTISGTLHFESALYIGQGNPTAIVSSGSFSGPLAPLELTDP